MINLFAHHTPEHTRFMNEAGLLVITVLLIAAAVMAYYAKKTKD